MLRSAGAEAKAEGSKSACGFTAGAAKHYASDLEPDPFDHSGTPAVVLGKFGS